jgi:signal transduction histidine kinase
MTESIWLNWAITAISLANTILLLWLGLTVLLNAERRTWGTWIAGTGLLLGGFFFIGHTTITGNNLFLLPHQLDFWWYASWWPLTLLPFVWYILVLWYAGFWSDTQSPIHDRHRKWLITTSLFTIIITVLFLTPDQIPSFFQLIQLGLTGLPSILGVPILIPVYTFYILICVILSLDALRRPGPTERVMGDLAREKARPWLVRATLTLLTVCLLVTFATTWALQITNISMISSGQVSILAWFDLGISSLICLAIILVGQAIVAYEIFTGKTLPRRGLFGYWRRAIILAFGYGTVVSAGLVFISQPVNILLLSAVLMSTFYALLSWRSYSDREQYINHLRPFLTSQRLFDRLVSQTTDHSPNPDISQPFYTLCDEVLEANLAYLVPSGPLSPLIGEAIIYPPENSSQPPAINTLVANIKIPNQQVIPLDREEYCGAIWAVPLWSERGLIGILLLGSKRDKGLYTQEEIEIAQNTGERLIDNKASAEIASRLMDLQRQRMSQFQYLDQRTRRILHDEILQQLHTALLQLSGIRGLQEEKVNEVTETLSSMHHQISNLLHELPTSSPPNLFRQGFVEAIKVLITEEFPNAFDNVALQIDEYSPSVIENLSPTTIEVLYYATREAIRNSARYGRGKSIAAHLDLSISIKFEKDRILIMIEDNGIGLTTTLSKTSGQGLALHSTMMAIVGGELVFESIPNEYTRVSLILPVN